MLFLQTAAIATYVSQTSVFLKASSVYSYVVADDLIIVCIGIGSYIDACPISCAERLFQS